MLVLSIGGGAVPRAVSSLCLMPCSINLVFQNSASLRCSTPQHFLIHSLCSGNLLTVKVTNRILHKFRMEIENIRARLFRLNQLQGKKEYALHIKIFYSVFLQCSRLNRSHKTFSNRTKLKVGINFFSTKITKAPPSTRSTPAGMSSFRS